MTTKDEKIKRNLKDFLPIFLRLILNRRKPRNKISLCWFNKVLNFAAHFAVSRPLPSSLLAEIERSRNYFFVSGKYLFRNSNSLDEVFLSDCNCCSINTKAKVRLASSLVRKTNFKEKEHLREPADKRMWNHCLLDHSLYIEAIDNVRVTVTSVHAYHKPGPLL